MRTVLWTGSRGWKNVGTVVDCVASLRKPFRSIVGDARGWDDLVWQVLSGLDLPRLRFDAQWERYGRSAGHKRNRLMLDWLQHLDADGFVVAGWDGKSRGTKGCMDEAERRGIRIWNVMYVQLPKEG